MPTPTEQEQDQSQFNPGGFITKPMPAPDPETGKPPATGYTAASYTPKAFETQPQQTVAGQLKGIISEDSPLMQQAARRAREAANARGLLNSSIAVGEAQQAVIREALPIAQQDAATWQRNLENTINAQHAQLAQQASAENTAMGQLTQALTQRELQYIGEDTKLFLGKLDADNRQLLQTNASAAQMFNEVAKNIAAIAADTRMSREAKDAATTTQLNMLNEGLQQLSEVARTDQAAIGGLDLGQYFLRGEEGEGGFGAGAGTTPSQGTSPLGFAYTVPENFSNFDSDGLGRAIDFYNSPANRPLWQQQRGGGILSQVAERVALNHIRNFPEYNDVSDKAVKEAVRQLRATL